MTADGSPTNRTTTRRFRSVECVVKKQHTTIAATTRMTRHDRVDQVLEELRALRPGR